MSGSESVGFYVLHSGLGNAAVQGDGRIMITGDGSYGLLSFINRAGSNGSVSVVQNQSSFITINGTLTSGLYGLSYGTGAITVDVAGRIDAAGDDSSTSLAYSVNANATGLINHIIRDTARLTSDSEGTLANAVMTLTLGLNASTTSVAGSITALNDNSVGVKVGAYNPASTAQHQLNLTGNASITSGGTASHGVHFENQGTGPSLITLTGNSRIATTGASASAIVLNAAGASTITAGTSTSLTSSGNDAITINARAAGANIVNLNGVISATGSNGVAVLAKSSANMAAVNIAATTNVIGGWGSDGTGISVQSTTGSTITNNGTISAGSDRAIFDLGRSGGTSAALNVINNRLITGYVEYAATTGNRFENAANASFVTRHFADTDGNGTDDVKRVAISDFGQNTSVFANAGLVSLGAVPTISNTNNAGYYLPTTGTDARALETSVYDLSRAAITQAQFTNLGRFEHSGVIDLRGAAVGNSLVMTSNAAAGGAAGTGLFVANGGQLLLNTLVGTGIPSGGQSNNQSDILLPTASCAHNKYYGIGRT